MSKEEKGFRKNELRLMSELMKNSFRSDRQLSKAIGVSQPTASRMRRKLESTGMIREYTMVPNFAELGYEILAITLVKLKNQLGSEEIHQAKKLIDETLKAMPLEVLMLERGIGGDFDGVIVSYHKNYASQAMFADLLKKTGFVDVDKLMTFSIDLKDEHQFLPLSLSRFAQCISNIEETRK